MSLLIEPGRRVVIPHGFEGFEPLPKLLTDGWWEGLLSLGVRVAESGLTNACLVWVREGDVFSSRKS